MPTDLLSAQNKPVDLLAGKQIQKSPVTTPWGTKPNAFERGLMEEGLSLATLAKKYTGLGSVPVEELKRQKAELEKQGKGTGISGWIGEELGSPSNYIIPAVAGKALKAAKPLVKPAIEAASPFVRKVSDLTKGITSKLPSMPDIGANALYQAENKLRQISNATYKAAKKAGVVFGKDVAEDFTKNISKDIAEHGILDQASHPKTFSALKGLQEDLKLPLELERLEQRRQLFSSIARPDKFGHVDADGQMAKIVMRAIDKTVRRLDPSKLPVKSKEAISLLNKARDQWAKSARYGEVSRQIRKAGGDPNKMKDILKKFLETPEKTKFFPKEELKAIEKATKYGFEAVPALLSPFGVDPSRLTRSQLFLPAMTELLTGGQGTPLVMAGTAARPIQNYMAGQKVKKLMDFLGSSDIRRLIK